MTEEGYMRLAIELAKKGCGHVNPNPMVGAVIVKDGHIIGQGYHTCCGKLHAEREALASCSESTEGADIYVTLEPCCHHGKQPPCTDAIIESGIKRVVIGSADPNPLVAGKGVRILKEHGVSVTENFLKDECDAINDVFFNYIKTGLPYVVMKYAMTMDGKTATYTGESKWITGEAARRRVHEDRNRYAAIMVGIGTVLKDDPMLNCRIEGGKDPVRVICDTDLRIPLTSKIVETASDIRTLIATSSGDRERISALESAGCEIIKVSPDNGHISLKELMTELGRMKLDSVLLEGGGTLSWSALSSGVVNKVQAYVAPKIFGGKDAPSPVGGAGAALPAEGIALSRPEITVIGDDILIESEVLGCSQE